MIPTWYFLKILFHLKQMYLLILMNIGVAREMKLEEFCRSFDLYLFNAHD